MGNCWSHISSLYWKRDKMKRNIQQISFKCEAFCDATAIFFEIFGENGKWCETWWFIVNFFLSFFYKKILYMMLGDIGYKTGVYMVDKLNDVRLLCMHKKIFSFEFLKDKTATTDCIG